MGKWVKNFDEMSKKDTEEAGGKAANLSEMTQHGFPIPPGFCVTSQSLQHVIDSNGLQPKIDELVASFDFEDYEGMETKTQAIRDLISNATIPDDLATEIKQHIAEHTGDGAMVAVRSSVSVKGSAIVSFPGMMDTYHYLRSEEEILKHIKMCWASLWTTRATFNRHHKNVEQLSGLIAPIVQRMINSEIAGILFTANPITSNLDEMVIEANFGLGESVVSGKSMNDFFLIDKNTLEEKQRKISRKTIICVFDEKKGWGRTECELEPEKCTVPTLDEAQVRELAEIGLRIEQVFGHPQDIEWAIEKGKMYILQARNIRNLATT